MKLVYSGQAIGLLPMQNGAIFAAKQKSLEHKIVISYMLYPFDSLKASPSTKSVYLLAKFGNRFREIEQQLNGYISCSAVALPGGKQLIVYPSGAAGLFDREGRAERGFTMQHEGNGPTGLCFHKGSVWAAYPEAGAIISYDPERFRQTMRLGGRHTGNFEAPESLTSLEDRLFVCNAGSGRISCVDTEKYDITGYASFEEPVHKFLMVEGRGIVLLDSGVYRL